MAAADYRLCDVCDGKVFYDANLNYEQGRDDEWAKRKAPFRWAGEEQGKPEHDDWLLRLDYLGDWAVLCGECSKTHRTQIVPIAAPQAEPKRPIIEVITEFDDIANWYGVILVVGETRHRFFIDYYTMQLADAEDFAETLRKALGITGGSDAE